MQANKNSNFCIIYAVINNVSLKCNKKSFFKRASAKTFCHASEFCPLRGWGGWIESLKRKTDDKTIRLQTPRGSEGDKQRWKTLAVLAKDIYQLWGNCK